MTKNILIILTSFLFLSFINVTNYDFKIEIGNGVGPLIIGQSTKREVRKIIGKGKVESELISFGNHTSEFKKVVYSAIGLELKYTKSRNFLALTDTLNLIVLNSDCKFKTQNGIGIGSVRKDIELKIGIPKTIHYNVMIDSSIYHSVRYENIEFIFDNKIGLLADSMNSKVKKIIMWK